MVLPLAPKYMALGWLWENGCSQNKILRKNSHKALKMSHAVSIATNAFKVSTIGQSLTLTTHLRQTVGTFIPREKY